MKPMLLALAALLALAGCNPADRCTLAELATIAAAREAGKDPADAGKAETLRAARKFEAQACKVRP